MKNALFRAATERKGKRLLPINAGSDFSPSLPNEQAVLEGVINRTGLTASCSQACSLSKQIFDKRVDGEASSLATTPLQFLLESYGFRLQKLQRTILIWKKGLSDAEIIPPPPYTPPGSIGIFEGFGPLALFRFF